jgi:hypothetical protein
MIYNVGDMVRCEDVDQSGPFIGIVEEIYGGPRVDSPRCTGYRLRIVPGTGHKFEREAFTWHVSPRRLLGLASIKYDPTQQGDKEDDI